MRSSSGRVLGVVLLPLALLCSGCGRGDDVVCYVSGAMLPVMEHLAKAYEEDTGQPIQLDYADAGGLLIRIKQKEAGDLYVCYDPFAAALRRDDLAHRIWTVAGLTPMIAVPKGNPRKITGLASLAQPGIRLALTHATYSTLGHINPILFGKTGLAEKITSNQVKETRTGDGAAREVVAGNVDAAIVWNAVIAARGDRLDAVDIEPQFRAAPVDAITSATFGTVDISRVKVSIATLKCSGKVAAATKFAEFVASEEGRRAFASFGFSPAPELEPEPAVAASALPKSLPR
jgi:molybdate transport system substrate-binding protein